MAQSKSAATPSDAETRELSDQIAALKADLAQISQTLVDMGETRREAAVNSATKKASELREQGEQHLQHAQAKVEDLTSQTTDAVRNQPAAAVGIAVGIGFLLGFLSGRK
ncbi:Membrane-anchored ribosome-binding protein, inhibits growth in stationary phase, ElaB/YqjD/DUF883 family [Roseovarius lutimaris]|uniref:Membrane-anchored ribosome-binding protein, inhibits growth in stationary phase, ElaB/YqjD/DUF883 family n=1 Tax=Roseovarius lutimaris TaxID=1005928 RepID=A0A1I5AKJ3_9RHOB|nr:DUF883 family protein [Roseovarius lutimaris]SFN62994.1 Membrane-anchored ribosome-binding protein, inhibits growth in stationary phase, ElaB/YqjD/DUF883 family [Roseovarius lutimaris]